MADQGRWFKLWVTADDDLHLSNLSLDDFARWCLFGIWLKKHGTDGSVSLVSPCNALMQKFRVDSFDAVLDVLRKFPNCSVSLGTNPTVTWDNWAKYQGDFSSDRVRKFRDVKRSKKRREERRREEKREEEKSIVGQAPQDLYRENGLLTEAKKILAWLNEKAGRNFRPVDANLSLIVARLKSDILPGQLKAIVTRKVREWKGDEEKSKYLRPATLFNKTKCEQYLGELPKIEESNGGLS